MEEMYDIPKEKFEFVNENEKITDKKFDTKPIGYFKDAFIRFRRNKGSVVAFIIIMMILLFAIIVPPASRNKARTSLVTYYSKKGPYVPGGVGLYNGGKAQDLSEVKLIYTISLGVAADGYDGKVETLEVGLKSYYQPLNSFDKNARIVRQGRDKTKFFSSNVNEYMAVGFKYITVTKQKFEEILKWEKENPDKHVLYPLIADNEYHFSDGIEANDANYWYKSDIRLNPISTATGEDVLLEYSPNLELEDNYLRDDQGNLVYWKYHGGGNSDETAMRKIRVLFYNYYQFEYGSEPLYFFGTDFQGYDMGIRLATGIRLSIILAVIVSAVNFVIGAIYGALEGYYGGAVDLTLERITDILSGVPFIVVATLFQIHLAKKVGPIPSMIFAFILTGWIGTAGTVRMQFYRFKNQEYVMAARTLGARDRRIIWKHIFPNTLGTLITSSVLVIPGVIFSESMLSFLGIINLGGAEITSLGTLLNEANGIWVEHPHMLIAPGLIISLLMICFNLFGNGLRDAFNPTLRGSDN